MKLRLERQAPRLRFTRTQISGPAPPALSFAPTPQSPELLCFVVSHRDSPRRPGPIPLRPIPEFAALPCLTKSKAAPYGTNRQRSAYAAIAWAAARTGSQKSEIIGDFAFDRANSHAYIRRPRRW